METSTALFDRTSLSVLVSGSRIPFSYDHALKPSKSADVKIRRWFHELTHLWQLFGSGYLANLALGQLDAAQESKPGPMGALRSFASKEAKSGVSALDIHECLAQYWEIHVLDPVRILREKAFEGIDVDGALAEMGMTWSDLELPAKTHLLSDGTPLTDNDLTPTVKPYSGLAFDLAMLVDRRYSTPYQLMLSRFGSRGAAVFFPIVSHFALQTRRPQVMFSLLIEQLASYSFADKLEVTTDVHKLWRSAYPAIAKIAQISAPLATGAAITPGWQVWMQWSSPSRLIMHYAALAKMALSTQGAGLDLALALPGDPECRRLLAAYFLPAVTVFDDGYSCEESSVAKFCIVARDLNPSDDLAVSFKHILSADELAKESMAIRVLKEHRASEDLLAAYGASED